MINGIAARLDFINGTEIFQNAFPGIDVIKQFKLTQNDLQLEQPLVANQSVYTFPVMVNQQSAGNTQFNTELRLNIQDTFLPQYVGMFILPVTGSATDTTWRPLTWANPAVLANATQMNAVYNGQLIISVNNTNYITQWKTSRFMKVPRTQQTAALGAGSPADELDGGDDGFYPMQPYVIISGSSNMGVTIKLANPPTAVDDFSRLAIVFRGIMAYNSTVTT